MDDSPAADALSINGGLDDPAFLEELRSYLLRFATLQLGNLAEAEDVVQEALMGALRNKVSFNRAAALKTWVFAILKNKIADSLRTRTRHSSKLDRLPTNDDDAVESLFDASGSWLPAHRPSTWGNPEEALRETQFWRVFELCLDHLPPRQARAFMMREFVELETHEICKTLEITANSLFVTLFRARAGLRECLNTHWFSNREATHAPLP